MITKVNLAFVSKCYDKPIKKQNTTEEGPYISNLWQKEFSKGNQASKTTFFLYYATYRILLGLGF